MPMFARLAAVPLVALCLLLPGMKCDDSVAQQPIGAAPEPPGKVKMYQEGGSLKVETTGKKGDIIINGRSLKGLFADVADLVDDVNSMTTVRALLASHQCPSGTAFVFWGCAWARGGTF